MIEHVESVGAGLQAALRGVVIGLPMNPAKPSDLVSILGVSRDIAGRVLSTLRASGPAAAVHHSPGPEPLRRVIKAARKKGAPEEKLAALEEAVGRFELLIRQVAGDRDALDAVISAHLPDVRQKFEAASKQFAFKGTSLLKGAMADVWLQCAMIHPSEPNSYHDVLFLYGTLGLRRLRPEVAVKFVYRDFGVDGKPPWHAFAGGSEGSSDGSALDAFCLNRPARVEERRTGDGACFVLAGQEVGAEALADKLFGEFHPKAFPDAMRMSGRSRAVFVAPSIPVKTLLFDVLIHESVNVSSHPELVVYDTIIDGMADPNDPARLTDRLSLGESLEFLGRGIDRFQCIEYLKYIDLLRYSCRELGWRLEEFRGYRCRVQYPMHGSQVCIKFDASSD